MNTIDDKIEKIKSLQYRLKKYRDLYPEITYRINILNEQYEKPIRKESIMHHIFKIFRKEPKYNFSQNEYFTCLILDDDIDFLKLIKEHVAHKLELLENELKTLLNEN
jgi:hypothetical protein